MFMQRMDLWCVIAQSRDDLKEPLWGEKNLFVELQVVDLVITSVRREKHEVRRRMGSWAVAMTWLLIRPGSNHTESLETREQ